MADKSFLKHAAVYALGDLLVMAGGFVLLPIYARRMTEEEFGLLAVLERMAEVTAICVLARGIPLATFTHYKQGRDDLSRQRAVGAGLLLALAAAFAGAALMALLAYPLGAWFEIDCPGLLWMAAVAALIDGLTVVVQAANQARLESRFYVTVSFAQFITKVALCVLFVVGFGWGPWGVILASLLRSALFAGALTLREWRRGLLWPDWQMLQVMATFVLPFVPTGLCFFVLNSGDRFFLLKLPGGKGQVGIYDLGYRLALLVGLFSLTPLNRVWSARLYDAAEEADAPHIFGQMATRILGAYLLLGLALCLFQDEVIQVFAGNTFQHAAGIVAPVVLAYWFQAASVLMESVFYVRRRTGCKSWIALASTAVMLLAYAALIPSYGAQGAALATLVGFVFHAALTGAVARRVFPVSYEFGRLAVLLGLAVGLWLASRCVGPGPWTVPVKLGLWSCWPMTLWIIGALSPAEKQWTRAVVGQLGRQLLASARRSTGKRRVLPFPGRSL